MTKLNNSLRILFLFQILYLSLSQIGFAQYSKEMGAPINEAGFNETAPYISLDGKTMVFLCDKDGKFKIYESTLGEYGRWNAPVAIDAINNFGDPTSVVSSPCYNYDASVIYFEANYKADSSGIDIFYSEKTNGIWSAPKSIGAPINSKGYDGQPSISPDGRILYFVREVSQTEKEEHKCYKLFTSEKGNDSKWQEPKALPMPVNLDCEMSPRISSDNKTLFFASARDKDKPGFDLFYTKEIAKNIWTVPTSIDTMNTPMNEAYPTISASGEILYYTISKTEKKKQFSSIYFMALPSQFKTESNVQFRGKITDLYSQKPIGAHITVTNPNTSRIISEFKNNSADGKYFYLLNGNMDYKIDVWAEGYSHTFFDYSTRNLSQSKGEVKDFSLYSKVSLRMNVFDKEIFQTLAAKIKVTEAETQKPLNELIDQPITGRFKLVLPIGKKYKIDVTIKNYEPYTMLFDLTGIVQFDEFERDVELTPIKKKVQIQVSDDVTKAGLPVEITLTNYNKNEKHTTTVKADSEGKFMLELREGDKYEINISPKGYSFYSSQLDLAADTVVEKVNVALTALKESAKLTFNDITFEFNSADLKASSSIELDRLVKLMLVNPEIKVEISAHTDDVGADAYNQKLSDRRAQSVVNYLIDKNIPVNNLVAKGYGKTKPVVPNTTDENKARNRRVEMKILEVK